MTWSDVADDLLADARARRARRTACAHALRGLDLSWAELDRCPPWLALPGDEARERLCASAGGWWLAAPLRACIDGRQLARVCDLLGEQELARLRDCPSVQRADALNEAPQALLPSAEDTPAHLRACGRALLGWSLPPDLRAPVLGQLGWAVDERHYAAFDTYAAWARQALAAAQQVPPAATRHDTAAADEDEGEGAP
jgi:hypothetical protein